MGRWKDGKMRRLKDEKIERLGMEKKKRRSRQDLQGWISREYMECILKFGTAGRSSIIAEDGSSYFDNLVHSIVDIH